LNHLQASDSEIENAIQFFEDRKVSFSTVRDFLKR